MVPPQDDPGFGDDARSVASHRLIQSVIAALAFGALSLCVIVLLAVTTQASLALPSIALPLSG